MVQSIRNADTHKLPDTCNYRPLCSYELEVCFKLTYSSHPEREEGLEPTTFSLEERRPTAELHPHYL